MNDEERQEERKLEPEGHVPAAYEASYLNLWTITLAGVGLVVVVLVILVLTGLLYQVFRVGLPAPDLQPPPLETAPLPGPRLQVAPPRELQALRATEQANLHAYAWVDQERGVVRIPIERAKELVAERGWPALPEDDRPPPEQEVTPDPSDLPVVVARGAELFQDLGCSGCHTEVDTGLAPTLQGIAGEPRLLETGETIIADDQYLRESILFPHVHIVAGYPPIMPSFEGRVTEEQLDALVAYMQSLE